MSWGEIIRKHKKLNGSYRDFLPFLLSGTQLLLLLEELSP